MEVYTFPNVGVNTKRSKDNSLTSNPSSTTKALDTKECVTLVSNNTFKPLPTITQSPITKLPYFATSTPDKGNTLSTTWGLSLLWHVKNLLPTWRWGQSRCIVVLHTYNTSSTWLKLLWRSTNISSSLWLWFGIWFPLFLMSRITPWWCTYLWLSLSSL